MYAVIKTGGKQYRVAKNQRVLIEKLDGEPGQSIDFKEVLMISDGERFRIGRPVVPGVVVRAEVIEQGRGGKIDILKFKRRKHQMKRQGHRQSHTTVKITDIA